MKNKCKNHAQCKGTADAKDGLCQYCREVEQKQKRETQTAYRLAQLEQKPIKPNYGRELDLGGK